MALATSVDGRVLARMVLVTCEGLDVYLFTWGGSRKCEQIRANPRVALCKDRIQIEGTAEILGGLFDPENASIRGLFEVRFPETVERWRDRPEMVLVKIAPTSVVLAGEPGEEPHLQFVDLENGVAYAEPWADH
jgi:general stress protein 26